MSAEDSWRTRARPTGAMACEGGTVGIGLPASPRRAVRCGNCLCSNVVRSVGADRSADADCSNCFWNRGGIGQRHSCGLIR